MLLNLQVITVMSSGAGAYREEVMDCGTDARQEAFGVVSRTRSLHNATAFDLQSWFSKVSEDKHDVHCTIRAHYEHRRSMSGESFVELFNCGPSANIFQYGEQERAVEQTLSSQRFCVPHC